MRTLLTFRNSCSLLLLVLVISGMARASAQADDASLDALGEAFDALIPERMAALSVPGVAVAVVHGGEVVWSQGYGVGNSASGAPVSDDSQFLVASLSKAVTSWAVLALVESGELDLDASIETYLQSWHVPALRYDANDVTLRRILSHTAGLSVDGYAGFPEGAELPALPALLDGEGGDRVAINSTPGQRHRYSGGGYTVLQLALEDLTGEPFGALMDETVFAPLGMAHSTYAQEATEATVSGHDYSGNPLPHELHVDLAAGGLYTTAPDLARFLAQAMPGPNGEPAGRGLLSLESVAEMFVPADVPNEQYGFGVYIETLSDGTIVGWHDGLNPGYKTLFVTLPQQGDALVFLSNSTRGDQMFGDVTCAWATWLGEEAAELCDLF